MADQETMAKQVLFGGRNLAENLNFIPDDKWEWKPESGAKSAHEVIMHLLDNFGLFNAQFGGAETAKITDRASAQTALLKAAEDYAANLRGASPERLGETLKVGGMDLPIGFFAAMAVVDTFHHHGQIAYLQTLWGDEQDHFDMSAFELLG